MTVSGQVVQVPPTADLTRCKACDAICEGSWCSRTCFIAENGPDEDEGEDEDDS